MLKSLGTAVALVYIIISTWAQTKPAVHATPAPIHWAR